MAENLLSIPYFTISIQTDRPEQTDLETAKNKYGKYGTLEQVW